MSLIVPKAYLKQRDEILAKDDFRQIGLLIWLDSAPSDWLDRVQDIGYPALISPLHDKDICDGSDGEAGSAKKSHYHVDIYFPGKKTFAQCQHIADYISDQLDYPVFWIVDREVHAKYLCHLNAPKKHRYPVTDVLAINGASYEKYVGCQAESAYVLEVITDILDWLKQSDIKYFDELIDFARQENKTQWLTLLLKTGTPIIKSYLQAKTFRDNDKIRNKTLKSQLALADRNSSLDNLRSAKAS